MFGKIAQRVLAQVAGASLTLAFPACAAMLSGAWLVAVMNLGPEQAGHSSSRSAAPFSACSRPKAVAAPAFASIQSTVCRAMVAVSSVRRMSAQRR